MDLTKELRELESNSFYLRNEINNKTITKLSAEKRLSLMKKIEQANALVNEALLLTGRENMLGDDYGEEYQRVEEELDMFDEWDLKQHR